MDLVWVWVTPKWKPQVSALRCKRHDPGSRQVCINWNTLNCAVFKTCWVFSCLKLTADVSWFLLQRKVQKVLGNEQLKWTSWSRLVIAWVGDEITCNGRQKRTFASLKKSKVQIWLSNLLQSENPILNTEIDSKQKKLFCIDVNSYVIEFLWDHNCSRKTTFRQFFIWLNEV